MENNPVLNRIWNEWLEKDRELSLLTGEERLNLVSEYQWVFPKESKRMVDLESLYNVHQRHNREEFHRWFYTVGGYFLSRVHLGENSYHLYKKMFKRQFLREKCTSDVFPSQVLLVLALLGYITDLDKNYSYREGSDSNHGYHYLIDRDKLVSWEHDDSFTSTATGNGIPEWVMSQTKPIKWQEEGQDPDVDSWSMHPDWLAERQYESIRSATVVKEGLETSSRWILNYRDYQYFYDLPEDRREELIDEWRSFQKLRDLSCGKVEGCKDDSDKYAGRFYSPMTNMKSEHRHRFLRLDGELVTEVDVSSAQPTFLGIMMYQQTGVMSEWLRQSLNGTFYEWIWEKTDSQEDRSTIKKWMMQYMYSCYQPKMKRDSTKPHRPTYENRKTDDPYLCFQQRLNRFLEKSEPDIYKMIDWHKRNPVYREEKDIYRNYVDDCGRERKKKVSKGKWCSMLSYELVKMEVQYIKTCISSLPGDMKFWTIHDCIACKESDSMMVKEIMEKVSREMYGEGITLKLKRENTSEDCS